MMPGTRPCGGMKQGIPFDVKHREQTKSHVADMLAAMAAHQQLERYACREHLKQQQHVP